MKPRHKPLNQKGASLIELVTALGVLMIAVVAASSLFSAFAKRERMANDLSEAAMSTIDILPRIHQLVAGVSDPSGKHTRGLCTLLHTTATKPGVDLVEIDLAPEKLNVAFPPSRWNHVLGNVWKEVNDPRCTASSGQKPGQNNPLGRCLTPADRDALSAASGTVFSSLVADVSITPLSINPLDDKTPFLPLPPGNVAADAKTVVFSLKANVHFTIGTDNTKRTLVLEEIISAFEIPYCDVPGSSGSLRVSASGTGLGGVKSPYVYNSPTFGDTKEPPLRFSLSRIIAQSGHKDPKGFVSTDLTKNIEVSCVETTYRCGNDTSRARTWKGSLELQGSASLSPEYNISPAQVAPRLRFMRNGVDLLATTPQVEVVYSTAARGKERFFRNDAPTGRVYEMPAYNPANPVVFPPLNKSKEFGSELSYTSGRNDFRYLIVGDGVAPMCANICGSGQPRPKVTIDYTIFKLPQGKDKVPSDFKSSFTADATVGCTVLYSKVGTARMGMASFGPGAQPGDQPDEPLDSLIPECALNDKPSVLSTSLLPATAAEASFSTTNGCLAATINGNDLTYSWRDCSESLPVMCYGHGVYKLAMDGGSPASRPFAQAPRRCYEVGREIHNATTIQQMFSQLSIGGNELATSGPLPTNGASIDFFNNAAQGIFLAPLRPSDRVNAAVYIQTIQKVASKGPFWVGVQKDQAGRPMAAIPWAQASGTGRDGFALFFRPDGVPAVRRPAALNVAAAAPTTAPIAALLFHDLHRNGLIAAAAEQPETHEFLCSSASGFFVTQNRASTRQADGAAACTAAGGLFVPPLTPLQWAQAMHAVAPVSPVYGFPDPAVQPRGVWVGVAATGGEWNLNASMLGTTWGTGSGSYFDRNGVFHAAPGAGATIDRLCQDKSTLRITVRSQKNTPANCLTTEVAVGFDDIKGLVNQTEWVRIRASVGSNVIK